MDKFQNIFLAEAKELIIDLEKALLEFEFDLNNDHSVKEIFRIMHSLKGGGSMFGFENISSITHDLETIYDRVRDKKILPTKELLDVTLSTVEHLKEILHDQFLQQVDNKANHGRIQEQIKAFLDPAAQNTSKEIVTAKELITYYVLIEPKATIFKNGTNPLFLVDDVVALGEALVFPFLADIPTLPNLQPDICYTKFEVILATEKPPSEINDVFIFAEDHCAVTVNALAPENLLLFPSFIDSLKSKALPAQLLSFETLRTLAEKHGKRRLTVNHKRNATNEKKNENSIRVSSDKLDELMNLVSELVTSQ